jgi:hypothetical protein
MATSASDLRRRGVQASRNDHRTPGPTAGTERRAARRAISVALLLIGVLTIVSGFWSLFLRGTPVVPAHVVGGFVFGMLSLLHVRYNRNALRLYLRDLGWSPKVLRLLIAAAISLVLLVPILRLA